MLGNYQSDNTSILDEIDREKDDMKEDIFSLKRDFFIREKEQIISEFAEEYKDNLIIKEGLLIGVIFKND